MWEKVFGKKINGTRVTPSSLKIVLIFILLLMASNFSTNYISLVLSRNEIDSYVNELLVRDLKNLHIFMTNQYDIYLYTEDLYSTVEDIKESAQWDMKNSKSLALGWRGGDLFFHVGAEELSPSDLETLEAFFEQAEDEEQTEGSINIILGDQEYFGIFKYNDPWQSYILRLENVAEFYSASRSNFIRISLIIVVITLICSVCGVLILRHLLRFIRIITAKIIEMQHDQAINLIELDGAVNDDITYMGMAFNSLSNTIGNLMNIFQKFVAKDVAHRAYREKEIRLEGSRNELTILFTDIKRFTTMTETLGTGIIKLLNLHYEEAIARIHDHNGDVGSIIGDALLAIFGTMSNDDENKSLAAIRSGYEILDVAAQLRGAMIHQQKKIIKERGGLTEEEQKVLDAVLLEVGVGIDGGDVFYGNIGSNERMVNTVIGDNVNSSARLEGLTRVYHVPLICSAYVRDEVLSMNKDYYFLELDRVMVKGKTEGKLVYWPIPKGIMDEKLKVAVELYENALQAYYAGDWREAIGLFRRSNIPPTEVFRERIARKNPPENWAGIWTMTSK